MFNRKTMKAAKMAARRIALLHRYGCGDVALDFANTIEGRIWRRARVWVFPHPEVLLISRISMGFMWSLPSNDLRSLLRK